MRKLLGILFFHGILLFSEFAYRKKNHFFFTLANILFGLGILLIFLRSSNVDWSLENSDHLATIYRIFESCKNRNREYIVNISTLPLYYCISKVLYEKLSFIQCYKKLFFVKRYLYEMFPSFKIF